MKWSNSERHAAFDGVRTIARYAFALLAWGLVTGIAMSSSVLSLRQAVGMALMVYGGSAQLAALPLIASNFPIWTVLLTGAVVNLRFVIFSAALHPHFKAYPLWKRALLGYLNGDLTFVLFMARYSGKEEESLRVPFFLGLALANWTLWQVGILSGILLGTVIPQTWGLSFAGTLALVAIVVPLVDRLSTVCAAIAAGLVAIFGMTLPFKLNLALAVLAAMLVGIASDKLLVREASAGEG
jgi:predicted branched-subunit amino acid permease